MLHIKPLDLMLGSVQESLPSALYMPHNMNYQREYMCGWHFEDISFALYDDTTFIAGCCMAVGTGPQGEKTISACGLPCVFFNSVALRPEFVTEVHNMVKKQIKMLFDMYPTASLFFEEFLDDGGLSPLAVALLDTGITPHNAYSVSIPLNWSEAVLWSHIRKSYKSLTNKAKKEFTLRFVEAASITSDDIELFRSLHIKVSGKQTRTHASWLQQLEAVKKNEAFIFFTYEQDWLVGASYFISSPVYCYYGVGAYRRELFDRPIAHAALWAAMLEAKKRGCHFFEMGRWYLPEEDVSAKESSIGVFKRGFGGVSNVSLLFLHTPPVTDAAH